MLRPDMQPPDDAPGGGRPQPPIPNDIAILVPPTPRPAPQTPVKRPPATSRPPPTLIRPTWTSQLRI